MTSGRAQVRLALLVLCRALSPGAVLALALVAVLALAREPGLETPLPTAADAARAERLERFLARQGAWALFAALAAPLLVLGAARAARDGRGRDADWLAVRPVGGATRVGASLAGVWAAAAIALAGAALAAEAAAGGEGASPSRPPAALAPLAPFQWMRRIESPAVVLLAAGRPAHWVAPALQLDALPAGARLRLRPTVAPGAGPAATLRASVEPAAGGAATSATARISGRTALELPLPSGAGPARIALERIGEGAPVVLPRGAVELLAPVADERLASLRLLASAALALAASTALALGLGAWMRPLLAALVVLSLALVAARAPALAPWVPGASLARAWALLEDALVPPAPGAREAAGAAACALAGAALAWLGARGASSASTRGEEA